MATKSSVDQLNSFLRGELSAVETYRMALGKLEAGNPARYELDACMQSHQQRVSLLHEAILQLGGTPEKSSGAWGAFAKAVEGTAKTFGDKAAIAALEQGEDHGVKDYKKEVDGNDLDLQTRLMVTSHLLPAQQATHDRMSSLKKQMRS